MNLQLDHLHVTLSGVSALVAEEAVAGLADELRRKLAADPTGAPAGSELPELRVAPVNAPAGVRPGELRSILAEQIMMAFRNPQEGGG